MLTTYQIDFENILCAINLEISFLRVVVGGLIATHFTLLLRTKNEEPLSGLRLALIPNEFGATLTNHNGRCVSV